MQCWKQLEWKFSSVKSEVHLKFLEKLMAILWMAEEWRKKCVTQVKILWTEWVKNIKTHPGLEHFSCSNKFGKWINFKNNVMMYI